MCVEDKLLSRSIKMSQKRKWCWDLQQKLNEHVKLCTSLSTASVYIVFRNSSFYCKFACQPCVTAHVHVFTARTKLTHRQEMLNSLHCTTAKKHALHLWRQEYLFNSWICQPHFRVPVLIWNLCAQANIHHTPRRKLLEHLSLGWTDLACWFVSETHLAWRLCNLCHTIKSPDLDRLGKKQWNTSYIYI